MSKAQGIANSANQGNFKNRIINGAMTVAQRGSTNVASGGSKAFVAADRFSIFNYFGSGQINTAVSTSVVPAGFSSSIGLTVGTAVPLSGSTGYLVNLAQTIEGFNIADCYTQSVTLSFWVRSSITGTYSVSFYNAANAGESSTTRWYVASYTINAANTWEQKTITISLSAGTASGTWDSSNGAGLTVAFGLGAESNRKGNSFLNTWGTVGTTYEFQASSQVNWASTSGATFYITGVQLEKGSTATSFDYRPYGTELALCQRYFCKYLTGTAAYEGTGFWGVGYNSTRAYFVGAYPVEMRATPTFSYSNLRIDTLSNGFTVTGIANDSSSSKCLFMSADASGGGLTQYRSYTLIANATTNAYLFLSAEL
jgi:hypothetical protein